MLESRYGIRRVEGVDVHWAEMGEGRPLVLLHGLADTHRTWGKVAPLLAQSRRVLAPDLPGHGLSGRPDASYALEWHARIVGGWLDALGLEDADVVGHSFGGGVAQHLLLQHRARIRRLALVAPGGLGREIGFGLRVLALSSAIVERVGQPFLGPIVRVALEVRRDLYDPDEIAWLAWTSARPGTARALARTVRDVIDWSSGQTRQFLDRAHEVAELPALALFWGTRDPLIPFAHAEEASRSLDGVALTRFECGHFPHRECAVPFARALDGFLETAAIAPPRLRTLVVGMARRPSFFRRTWSAIVSGVRRMWRTARPVAVP